MEGLFKDKARSIAVGVDGSEPGWEAFSRAVNMAKLLNLELDALFVVQLRKMGYFAFIDRHLQEDKEAAAKKVFDEAGRRAEKAGITIVKPDIAAFKAIAEKWPLEYDGKWWEKGLYEKIRALD